MARPPTPEFLQVTKNLWQEKYDQPLLEEDLHELTTNITDFLEILQSGIRIRQRSASRLTLINLQEKQYEWQKS